jgi:hypothetical protein
MRSSVVVSLSEGVIMSSPSREDTVSNSEASPGLKTFRSDTWHFNLTMDPSFKQRTGLAPRGAADYSVQFEYAIASHENPAVFVQVYDTPIGASKTLIDRGLSQQLSNLETQGLDVGEGWHRLKIDGLPAAWVEAADKEFGYWLAYFIFGETRMYSVFGQAKAGQWDEMRPLFAALAESLRETLSSSVPSATTTGG